MQKSWNAVYEVMALVEKGRLNAARARWSDIDSTFRNKILEFVLGVLRAEESVKNCPTVQCDSDYGQVTISKEFCECLRKSVPLAAGVR